MLIGMGTTQLGEEILKYPDNLNAVHVAAMIRYSAGHEDARERQLYMGIVFYIMSCGLQLLQLGKETADAMNCFCPCSDIVTLINIVGPVLANRTRDSEFIDRLTINPSVLDRLRSDIDELIDFLGLTQESLTSFVQLNPLDLVDSIVTFLITKFTFWCNPRIFQYSMRQWSEYPFVRDSGGKGRIAYGFFVQRLSQGCGSGLTQSLLYNSVTSTRPDLAYELGASENLEEYHIDSWAAGRVGSVLSSM
jgi:hypothetical protein